MPERAVLATVSNPATYDPRVTIDPETRAERGYAVTLLGRRILRAKGTYPDEPTDRQCVGLSGEHAKAIRWRIVLRDHRGDCGARDPKGVVAAWDEYSWGRREQALLRVNEQRS